MIASWDQDALRRQTEQENARRKQLEAHRAHERARQQAEQERQRNVAKQKAAHKKASKEKQKKRALEQDLTNAPRPQKVQRMESNNPGTKCKCGKSFKSTGALNDHLKMASKCPYSIKNQNQPTKQAAQRSTLALGSSHPNLHKAVKAGNKQQKQAAQLNPLSAQFKPGALSTLGISQANLPRPLPKVGNAVDKPVAEPASVCFAPYVPFRWN